MIAETKLLIGRQEYLLNCLCLGGSNDRRLVNGLWYQSTRKPPRKLLGKKEVVTHLSSARNHVREVVSKYELEETKSSWPLGR